MAKRLLRVNDLNVFYGDAQALWDVGFHVEKGEIYAIIGSNGAGKSTVLKTLSGLLRPASGWIEFAGTRVEGKGADFIVIRELTGGIYYGELRGRTEDGNKAFDTNVYSRSEIIRVTELAFDYARKRKKKLTAIDKANVLATSRLWRERTSKE